jgi:hypothetical protein
MGRQALTLDHGVRPPTMPSTLALRKALWPIRWAERRLQRRQAAGSGGTLVPVARLLDPHER